MSLSQYQMGLRAEWISVPYAPLGSVDMHFWFCLLLLKEVEELILLGRTFFTRAYLLVSRVLTCDILSPFLYFLLGLSVSMHLTREEPAAHILKVLRVRPDTLVCLDLRLTRMISLISPELQLNYFASLWSQFASGARWGSFLRPPRFSCKHTRSCVLAAHAKWRILQVRGTQSGRQTSKSNYLTCVIHSFSAYFFVLSSMQQSWS